MQRKIQFLESYLNSLSDVSFLLYPHHPYDLAVFQDGNKIVAKPIIGFSLLSGHFKWKGKYIHLRDFREEDNGTIPPDWVEEWLQERIDSKPLKIDMRMNEQDRFVLNGVVQKRKNELETILSLYP